MSTVPTWVTDAIFYQIFPERFENGDTANDPHGAQAWGGVPKPGNYFGGDLQGIMNRIDHLKTLGINALYLNPIFAAESNHKYNTKDYLTIDPSFGSNELFDTFIEICHRNGIRVVLDGVFNHVGTAHFAFQDVKKNGRDSQYASWFNIFSFPVSEARHPNYECWWGHGSLPKLMVQHPEVKQHIFDVTKYWTAKGIDGWRLDVPNELPHVFWKEWRSVVRSINPECYIVGELWEDASSWLKGDEFDATMNYRFRQACIDYFAHGTINSRQFMKRLETVRSDYPMQSNYAMQNLLGSHDTERYLTLCKGDLRRVKLSLIMQMTYIGAPMVYYGDEIGMEGGKDPDCRRCMIWDKKSWNMPLFKLTKSLAHIRSDRIALRQGDFTDLTESLKAKDGIVAFQRGFKKEKVVVVLNNTSGRTTISIPVASSVRHATDELEKKKVAVAKGILKCVIPAHSGKIFTINKEK
jgi:glycosidase